MRMPKWVVPTLVILCAVLGIGGARLLTVPSVVREFPAAPVAHPRTTVLVVSGVKCVDTAERAANQLKDLPGVLRFAAYASRNRVEVTFDPARVGVQAIREAIEGPVYDEGTQETQFHVFQVLEVDGIEVSRS